MTKEELLKPRYKVIEVYPGAPIWKGLILDEGEDPEGKKYIYNYEVDEYIYNPQDFPHLFQKLEWWQERKPEDMPKYMKHVSTKEVVGFGNQSKITPSDVLTSIGWLNLYDCLPATEEEFNSQKQPTNG